MRSRARMTPDLTSSGIEKQRTFNGIQPLEMAGQQANERLRGLKSSDARKQREKLVGPMLGRDLTVPDSFSRRCNYRTHRVPSRRIEHKKQCVTLGTVTCPRRNKSISTRERMINTHGDITVALRAAKCLWGTAHRFAKLLIIRLSRVNCRSSRWSFKGP